GFTRIRITPLAGPGALMEERWPGALGPSYRFEDQGREWSVAFSPDGRRALLAGDGIRLWDLVDRRLIRHWRGHCDEVRAVTFSPDGRYAISGSTDQTVRVWDVETGMQLRYFQGHTEAVACVAVSTDNRTILSGGMDGTVRV